MGTVLPWSYVRLTFFILLLAATGMANRALARETLEEGPATLAGCAAIFLGYALFSIYKRCDFAELTGGFWIPLLLLYALRRRNPSGSFWRRTFDGSAAPLALIVAAIWLSNGPLGIMASYLLAAVALLSAVLERSLMPVVRASVSAFAGMGVAALYLIPAVWERSWISIIRGALDPTIFRVESNWFFARHADPSLAAHDFMLHMVSTVATAMLVIAFVGGAVIWIRRVVPGERRWWLPLAMIPPTVIFLLLPISQSVWNVLPEFRLLQFPWRWLVVLEAPMALSFASAVWFDRRTARIFVVAACAALFVGISLAAPRWWFIDCSSSIASVQSSLREGMGVLGKPEYAPPGIRYPVVYPLVDSAGNPLVDSIGNLPIASQVNPIVQDLPIACLLESLPIASAKGESEGVPRWHGEPAKCKSSSWHEIVLNYDPSLNGAAQHKPEQRWITGVAEHAGYLILRLRYYPAWGVKVNGIPVTATAERERGLMAVPVPMGHVNVSVNWTTTGDVVVARWVSGVALLLVIGLYGFERRVRQNRFNTGSLVSVEERRERGKRLTSKPPKDTKQKMERKPGRGGGS